MVGAVIVCEGKIIGEGYHVHCGEGHAEVNAIRSVKDPSLLRRSTLYVTLEPCSHYGKTPPCADLIIDRQIPRIVVGTQDPFPEVSGRGIRKLREAGREVAVGILETECRELIRRFITFHTRHRPFITLKWAESADGFIDRCRTDGKPTILSSPLTAMQVHKMRAEHTAILVGTRTARLDNPSLTVRQWYGRSPVRIVLDRNLSLLSGTSSLPADSLHLFDGSVPTLVFTERTTASPLPRVEYIPTDYSRDILPQLLHTLYERKLQSLLVEGGARLLQSFIDAHLWDEAMIEQSPMRLQSGVAAPVIKGDETARTIFGRRFRYYTPRGV
jgi:diaminohydroxyphosphoribosylaminopyrimidine deaminase/5-amino-6-(5-phosphoribosylamino)uracil reductase